jgi:hypothetical protein
MHGAQMRARRSTRFLKQLGFDAIGVDVSASMIEHARSADGTWYFACDSSCLYGRVS